MHYPIFFGCLSIMDKSGPYFRQNFSPFSGRLPPGKPLTFPMFYGIFSLDKSCDEDTRSRKDSQRGCHLVQGFRTPAGNDTTSELSAGNG